MNQTVKVVVTGAGALLGQGIIRALQKANFAVDIVALDPGELAVGFFWANRAYQVPLATASNYLERIQEILDIERPQALLVGTDVELPVFAKERQRLEREHNVKIVVSSPELIELADDKWLTYHFLRDCGFHYPESCLSGEEERLIEQVGFPLIVKPRRGARGFGFSLVHDRLELQRAVAALPDPIIQECVGDDQSEYTAGVLYFDGRCDASIVMRRELRDGNTHRAFVDTDSILNGEVRRVAECFRPYGPANFQFRLDQGVPKIFEINCRFSGTTIFRVKVGFNEVEMVLRYILWGEPVTQPSVDKVTILRYLSEIVIPNSPVIDKVNLCRGSECDY